MDTPESESKESESKKRMARHLVTPVPPPTWAARRDWPHFAIRPDVEAAVSFTDRELARLKFTKWLVETGSLIP